MKAIRATLLGGTIVLAAVLFAAVNLQAQMDDGIIQYRQKVMGSNGANMGGIGDILKNKLPYAKNIALHAMNIENNAKMTAAAFEKKVTEGKTDAKAEIWQKMGEFKEYADKLETEAAKLAKLAEGGDMMAVGEQVKAVGGACKKCHDEFRKPKEQSYKNKM